MNLSLLKFCKKCGKCCERGTPMVLPRERDLIIKKTGEDILKKYKNAYIIPGSPCPFYNKKTGRCIIEKIKPIDCRAFPICFTLKNNNIEWRVYAECPAFPYLTKKFIKEAKKELLKIPPKFRKTEVEILSKSGFKTKKLIE